MRQRRATLRGELGATLSSVAQEALRCGGADGADWTDDPARVLAGLVALVALAP
jgi:hypothetical protein